MQSKQIIETLKSTANRKFLQENLGENPQNLALRKDLAQEYPLRQLSQILHLYHKAKHKLPTCVEQKWALSPKSYEQSSSETTAQFKADLFSGRRMLNLTGGLGVDDLFFAQNFDEVDSYELDEEIHDLAFGNFNTLGFLDENKVSWNLPNRIHGSAQEGLQKHKNERYHLIYVDPDRRDEAGSRSYFLEHTQPDVMVLLNSVLKMTDNFLIKASPMLDISRALDQLKTVQNVWVVSVAHEVKELLLHVVPKSSYSGEAGIHAVELDGKGSCHVFQDSGGTRPEQFHEAANANCFYDLSGSLSKAGLTNAFAHERGIQLLYHNGAYATGADSGKIDSVRSFHLLAKMKYKKKELLKYLRTEGIRKANVARRNFEIDVKGIRNTFKLQDGGEDYLFFFSDLNGQRWMVHAQRMI